ncbi:MAG: hypothetical protein JNL84_14935 [Candidatus Accumulibacter sp.]|nr:hypothetical protein [Accumulibacter sp.]
MNITLNHMNLWAAWIGILLGMLSGALIGLFFHHQAWLGGYDSWRRRLLRLGHISFFGIAFLNLAFASTFNLVTGDPPAFAAWSLLAGAVLMPAVCFLAAWRQPFRHLFFLPVLSLLSGVAGVLFGEVL